MENVTVTKESIAEQEAADQAAAKELQRPSKGSKRLSDIVNKHATPDTFTVKEEESPEEVGEETATADTDIEEPESEPGEATEDDAAAQEEVTGEDEQQEDGESPDAGTVPESVSNRIKEQFPDADLSNPEEFGKAVDKLSKDSASLEAEREANKKVYDLFENSDEMVQLARAMDGGTKTFMEALAATVDIPEALEEMKEDDPEQYKKVMKEQARREVALEQRASEQEEMQKKFTDNQEDSKDTISAFQKEKGMDEGQGEAFINKVGDHFENMVHGKITPEFLDVMHRGLNYEKAIEEAKEEGKIKGKNERINAEKRKKAGDGLPKTKTGKPKEAKDEPSNGKRAIAGIVSGSKSTFT